MANQTNPQKPTSKITLRERRRLRIEAMNRSKNERQSVEDWLAGEEEEINWGADAPQEITPTPAPAPRPNAAEVAPPPPPTSRPTAQRSNGGGFSLNFWYVLIGIIAAFFVFSFLQNGSSAPAANNNGQTDTGTAATQDARDEEFFCPRVMGLREGRELWLNVTTPLQNDPTVDSPAIRGIQVVSSDILVATGETDCDEENIWLEVDMQVSSNRVRTGWVQIANAQDSWYVWLDQESAPVPVATEDASASQGGQSMRSIRVGNGTCVPQLQTADFYNADAVNARGEDMNPDWTGFWVKTSDYRSDEMIFVRARPSLSADDVARFGFNPDGTAQPIEVIAYSDGFHFACANGLVWWNVRHHSTNGSVTEGWVAETDGETTTLMIEGF